MLSSLYIHIYICILNLLSFFLKFISAILLSCTAKSRNRDDRQKRKRQEKEGKRITEADTEGYVALLNSAYNTVHWWTLDWKTFSPIVVFSLASQILHSHAFYLNGWEDLLKIITETVHQLRSRWCKCGKERLTYCWHYSAYKIKSPSEVPSWPEGICPDTCCHSCFIIS